MILDGIAGMKFLLGGQFPHFVAIIKAHFSFYNTFSRTRSKRKEISVSIKEYTRTAVYIHSVIADYYLRGKKTFSEIDKPERFLK
jgi:hypothetical protein